MNISTFLQMVKEWAEEQSLIYGVALVGSYANGTNQIDSDLDLVIICEDLREMIQNKHWVSNFGVVHELSVEDYGALQSLRTFYDCGSEVEFGITNRTWAKIPADAGTRQVILGGIHILYDPDALLCNLISAVTVDMV